MPSAKKKRRNKINKQKELFSLLTTSFAILVILLTILNIQHLSQKPNPVLGVSTEINFQELEKEKVFWEEFLAKNPTYYDGWKKISEIEYLLGENDSAVNSLKTANRIDSNR